MVDQTPTFDHRPVEVLADEVDRLRAVIDHLAPTDGRWIVWRDDLELVATDAPGPDDEILHDRGENW